MKRLIFGLIALTLFKPLVWGDTVTGGSVGLLKPTTGVIDTSRSWADKYNANFDMIASTLTDALNTAASIPLIVSSNIANGAVTGTQIAAGTVASSNTLPGQLLLNGTDVVFSTHVKDGNLNGIDIAVGTLGGTQTVRGITNGVLPDNVGVIFASHSPVGLGGGLVQNNAHVIVSSMIKGGQTFMSTYDEGSAIGNANTLDCVGPNFACTQSGSTVTFTHTDSVSEGGGTPNGYDITIGSPGAVGYTAYMGDENGWAINFASVGVWGNWFGGSVTARIYVGPGAYPFTTGSTIPAGAYITFHPSAVIVMANTQRALTIYGRNDGKPNVIGLNVDLSSQNFVGQAVFLSSGAYLRDWHIYNGNGRRGTVPLWSVPLGINEVSNVTLENGKLEDGKAFASSLKYGDKGTFLIRGSSFVKIDNMDMSALESQDALGGQFGILGSTNVIVKNSKITMAQTGITFGLGGGKHSFTNNDIYSIHEGAGAADSEVIKWLDGNNPLHGTSSCTFTNNRINFRDNISNTIILIGGASGAQHGFNVFNGNRILCPTPGGNVTAIATQANSYSSIFRDNDIVGCTTGMSDAGSNTIYASRDNTVNGGVP